MIKRLLQKLPKLRVHEKTDTAEYIRAGFFRYARIGSIEALTVMHRSLYLRVGSEAEVLTFKKFRVRQGG